MSIQTALDFGLVEKVLKFDDESHSYVSIKDGSDFTPVTRFIDSFAVPFDREGISYRKARYQARDQLGYEPNEKEIIQEQQRILSSWDKKRDDSIVHGNFIHKMIEDYGKGVMPENKYLPIIRQISKITMGYYAVYNEKRIYHKNPLVAGTVDIILQRQKDVEKSVFDISDIKTNLEKGIVYDSIWRGPEGVKRHYNKFFLPPISHLEDCNYNRYALQQSIYAYMIEMFFKVKIGRLFIIFVRMPGKADEKQLSFDEFEDSISVETIPLNYMKAEVQNMMMTKADIWDDVW